MYVIYMNRVNPHITVHYQDCSRVGQQGGVSDTYPPTGWYCHGFDEARHARWVARFMADRTGWPIWGCSTCEA